MAETDSGTVVESIYLENRTTRKAFYLVEIRRTSKNHEVVVKWGRLGSEGQQAIKGRHTTLDGARVKMHSLAEAKKLRNYQEAKKPKANSSSKQQYAAVGIKDNNEMNRFADLE